MRDHLFYEHLGDIDTFYAKLRFERSMTLAFQTHSRPLANESLLRMDFWV